MVPCWICRLDAGSFGTMGVGPGFAIAAALYCRDQCPQKKVVCVEGDSAIGFSIMELETASRLLSILVLCSQLLTQMVSLVPMSPVCIDRYHLPIVFIVMNNNGIGYGLDKDSFEAIAGSGDRTLM